MKQEIKIDKNNYEPFRDYKDFMVQAFNIGCSICNSPEIAFVLKGHPEPIGNIVRDVTGKTDEIIETKVDKAIDQWQDFDDANSDKNIPTYLCEECWNSFE